MHCEKLFGSIQSTDDMSNAKPHLVPLYQSPDVLLLSTRSSI